MHHKRPKFIVAAQCDSWALDLQGDGMPHVLMTGVTGLLGGQLLTQLMQRGSRLAVLVRPTAEMSARERVEAILVHEEELAGQRLPRPVVLEGDLTAPLCGLAPADCDWVERSCASVLHNAASLEFIGADRAGEPWRTNLSGTQNLLALAERAEITEFHHVSTAYVCGLTPGPIPESPSDDAHGFRNDYERSKHEAEWLVRSSPFLVRPTFYRPAVIVGHSRTGATTTYHGMMAMLRLMTVIVRSLPADDTGFRPVSIRLAMSGDEQRNMVPVDWVAEAIARLVVMPAARGRTIHLAPRQPITAREIVDATSSYLNSGKVAFCGPGRPQDLNEMENLAYSGKALYEGYEQTDPVFETRVLEELLPDLPCPAIDEAMLHRFLAFGESDCWGKRRRTSPEFPAWAGKLLESLSPRELVRVASDVMGGQSVGPFGPVGLRVRGPGGGDWTIDRRSASSATLTRGLADGAPVVTIDAHQLPSIAGQGAVSHRGHPVDRPTRRQPTVTSST